MMDFIKSRLIARAAGLPVVMLGALAAFVCFATITLDFSLAWFGLIILSCPILAATYRIVKGGDQGTTDLEITDGQRKIAISNIPLGSAGILTRAINLYGRYPLPRATGVVKEGGNPADEKDLIELSSDEVSASVEVSGEGLKLPEDAVSISTNPGAKEQKNAGT
jgi:hypothetical protein